MELDIARARELLDQREAIDAELSAMFSGTAKEKKQIICGNCSEPGHSARTCTKPKASDKKPEAPKPPPKP